LFLLAFLPPGFRNIRMFLEPGTAVSRYDVSICSAWAS
jgi:hypothetical protein